MIVLASMGVVMVEQAVCLSDACEECGGVRKGWVVQLVRGGRLRWEVEWECVGCQVTHQWVWGPAPAHVRDLLIDRHGVEHLKIVGRVRKRGVLLKVFREVFGASITEAQEFGREATGPGYAGTRVEVELLSRLLRERGVEVEVVPGSRG
ncbi:hypothetical protein ACIRPH_09255 [Nocardiopsis sp. NPDC101807]|uniref:hypothetical protein n=1 Tax=Nocardiopsis sp. NPDC101807 TaxID=3364339 RepID=UPI0037F5E6EF